MEENKNTKIERDQITKQELMPDHDFDGIRELDNDSPLWLTVLFVISVIFAYTYMAKYHLFKAGPLQAQQYALEMAEAEKANMQEELAQQESPPGLSQEEKALLAEKRDLEAGARIFKNYCVVCHLAQGQGLVGPNLTDEYWIHGGRFEDIIKIINDGVIEKGMIPWKNQLSENNIRQVAIFVQSLKGSNPPNPKEPQGEKYVE